MYKKWATTYGQSTEEKQGWPLYKQPVKPQPAAASRVNKAPSCSAPAGAEPPQTAQGPPAFPQLPTAAAKPSPGFPQLPTAAANPSTPELQLPTAADDPFTLKPPSGPLRSPALSDLDNSTPASKKGKRGRDDESDSQDMNFDPLAHRSAKKPRLVRKRLSSILRLTRCMPFGSEAQGKAPYEVAVGRLAD